MTDPPPSYEVANARDHWSLIAQYIPSRDLCSAALVCRAWYKVFAPHLWGNPASHFGVQNDVVYVALTRFKRTLAWARLSTRELTHTLHFPPAHAELYDGPHADWLRNVLERLPRLQCLIVNGLPFFDHAALTMLRRPSDLRRASLSDSLHQELFDFPLFSLRYLDASRCPNATYSGLAEALRHFPALLYLDLSRTKAARDVNVLSTLRYCRRLRILKLRAISLRDEEIEVLAMALKTRLRSLDIRDNHLTDLGARILLSHCFRGTKNTPDRLNAETPDELSVLHPDSPPASSMRLFDWYNGEDLDERLRTCMSEEFAGRSVMDDSYQSGITHLYISNNQLTVEGMSGLLRSKSLYVLDAGTISKPKLGPHRTSSLLSPAYEDREGFSMPGAEKLTPVLAHYASKRLTYLRISHTVVTKNIPASDLTSGRSELEGSPAIYFPEEALELDPFNEVMELPTRANVQELPSLQQAPVELPADDRFPSELPGDGISQQDEVPTVTIDESAAQLSDVQRGSAFAAEAIADFPSSSPSPVPSAESNRSSFITAEDRRARLNLRQSNEGHLHPGMLPKVQTLVLTNIPATSTDESVSQRLIQFVQDCGSESQIAQLSAQGAYALPPGRNRKVAEHEFAESIFALRKLVLEIARPEDPTSSSKKLSTSWRQYPTRSSTEDDDSTAFWSAAGHDFSFFGDEECGIPDLEPGRSVPLAALTEKMTVVASEPDGGGMQGLSLDDETAAQQHKKAQSRSLDTIAELTRFRRDRKAVFEAAVARGADPDPMVEGYWSGEIAVVRPSSHEDGMRTGDVDVFGNYYEDGYNYR
ncbi:hypothetical protein K490DRAFT_33861 [Saccharata proteae CBS 121410]|uniref:F-box domain-containing protein n=1 Tax=Saccharata proteae CBS 121410 TaxID=1314787 RepID=A0A9P4I1U3_9PEZI|nr:hypothetical protein K490DRAFT_33861 [Saccharata proteae CBS 121410]